MANLGKTDGRIVQNLNDAISFAVEMCKIPSSDINVPYLVGPPGIGKTKMLSQTINDMGFGFLAFTPGLERLEKFGGIPDMVYMDVAYKSKDGGEEKKKQEIHTKWSVPEMISRARVASSKYEKVFILLDDWHLAPAAIQAIGFELFTHKALSGAKVPDNVYFILAGNESSAAGAKTQLSAIINRCTVLYCKPDLEYWIKNYALPNGLHESGISFFSIAQNAEIFNEAEQTTGQFATPRSWTSKPLTSSINFTMSLPMSWISPCTVPSTTLPIFISALLACPAPPSLGFTISETSLSMAPDMISSGRKYSPFS